MFSKWFDYQPIPINLDLKIDRNDLKQHDYEELFNLAKKYYEQYAFKNEQEHRKNDKNGKYLFKLINSGTYGDRVSALVLLVQKSPLYSLSYLRSLIGLIKQTNRKISIMVIEVLRELFLTQILPSDRKLTRFIDQPHLPLLRQFLNEIPHNQSENSHLGKIKVKNAELLNQSQVSQTLALYYFENVLKQEIYNDYMQHLKVFSLDQLDVTKLLSIQTMQELLIHKPEGELELLVALINKLGDPKPKVANKVCNLLKEVVNCHPNMRLAILEEIESLLFKRANNINTQAPFYATMFIKSSMIFDKHKDGPLVLKVIKIYFGLFKMLLKEKEMPLKLMALIFNGINIAFPYLGQKDYSYDEILREINVFYEILNKVNFNTSIEILAFLFQFLFNPQGLVEEKLKDRFYKCLYKKLLDPELKTSIKQDKYFALLHKALSQDYNIERTKAFFKRLLTLNLSSPVPFVAASLIIMSEVSKHRNDFKLNDFLVKSSALDLEEDQDDTINKDSNTLDAKDYDFLARDPKYSGDIQRFHEIRPLINHFHPTVSLYARDLLNEKFIDCQGDPMKNFAFYNFLESFTHKNPKTFLEDDVKGLEESTLHSNADTNSTKKKKGKAREKSQHKLPTLNAQSPKGGKSIGDIDFAQDYTTEKTTTVKRKKANEKENRGTRVKGAKTQNCATKRNKMSK